MGQGPHTESGYTLVGVWGQGRTQGLSPGCPLNTPALPNSWIPGILTTPHPLGLYSWKGPKTETQGQQTFIEMFQVPVALQTCVDLCSSHGCLMWVLPHVIEPSEAQLMLSDCLSLQGGRGRTEYDVWLQGLCL